MTTYTEFITFIYRNTYITPIICHPRHYKINVPNSYYNQSNRYLMTSGQETDQIHSNKKTLALGVGLHHWHSQDFTLKVSIVVLYSITSVGLGADSGLLAVSPQVT